MKIPYHLGDAHGVGEVIQWDLVAPIQFHRPVSLKQVML